MTRIVVAGATGLVGGQVVMLLAKRKDVETHVVARRPVDELAAAAIAHIAEPAKWPEAIAEIEPDVVVSALGTTMRMAGSKEAFHAVDHDLVVAVGTAAKAAGARHMMAVSSVGASADSSNFYLKTKGEAEAALGALGFTRTDFLRPGLLTGCNRQESRPGERLGILLSPFTDMLMIGGLSRYRSIPSELVANAIATLAVAGGTGAHIHENDAIRALAG